jgi:cytochrome c biogenesis protein CcmG/thiol:disulfide interchange protein DsbE
MFQSSYKAKIVFLLSVCLWFIHGCSDDNYVYLKGEPAADFSIERFDGGTFQLSDHKGKPILINFFASWCVSCGTEIPVLAKVAPEYSKKGVVFVGVAINDTEIKARKFIGKYNLSFATGLDKSGKIRRDYQLYGMPTTLFVDKQGVINYLHLGGVTEDLLRYELDKLL